MLGRETLSRQGYRVGDRVPIVAMTGSFEEVFSGGGTEVSSEVTIVGSAVLPSGGGENRLGTGGAVDFEFLEAADPSALSLIHI